MDRAALSILYSFADPGSNPPQDLFVFNILIIRWRHLKSIIRINFHSPPSSFAFLLLLLKIDGSGQKKLRIDGTRWQWDSNPRPPGPHVN